MPLTNNAIIFREIPTAAPIAGQHLVFVKRKYDLPVLKNGELILKNMFVSIDPFQRIRMRDPSIKGYFPAYKLGEAITNYGVGRVLESADNTFPIGSYIFTNTSWSEYSHIQAHTPKRKIEQHDGVPLSQYVGAIGMPGMTAYSAFYEIGRPQKSEVIFVTAASGAVGQIVVQLAKKAGLRVIGCAGSDAKVQLLMDTYGLESAFNYKRVDSLDAALAQHCPDGIDIVFENVGGPLLEALLNHCNKFARIIACGMVSQYNSADSYGIKTTMQIVSKSITMRGFIVSDPDFWPKYSDEFYMEMPRLLARGEIVAQEDIALGLEAVPQKFADMLKGDNSGKCLVSID